jgi:branched-chain amino acid transport system ATP-binding protein
MPILEGQGISKHFGGLAALTNVDFTVEQGEVLGLIGPNGAGKTTLFNVISAAFPPTGTIKFKSQTITGLKPYQICRVGVARTFQSVKIFPNMSVLENVALGCSFGKKEKVSAEEAEEHASELLEFVDLQGLQGHDPGRGLDPGQPEAAGSGPGPGHQARTAPARMKSWKASTTPRWPRPWIW